MKDFQGYRQKKNNEFAQQKAQRLELRNGKEQMRTLRLTNPAEFKQLFLGTTFPAWVFLGRRFVLTVLLFTWEARRIPCPRLTAMAYYPTIIRIDKIEKNCLWRA